MAAATAAWGRVPLDLVRDCRVVMASAVPLDQLSESVGLLLPPQSLRHRWNNPFAQPTTIKIPAKPIRHRYIQPLMVIPPVPGMQSMLMVRHGARGMESKKASKALNERVAKGVLMMAHAVFSDNGETCLPLSTDPGRETAAPCL